MLLSSGGFAIYHTEARVFDMLAPRFGNLSRRRNQQELLRHWLGSELFRRSGLAAEEFRSRVLGQCRGAGDFLRILMESIAESQGVQRWAECTPTNLLYLKEIFASLPEAVVIHIIRDGRDVALSMDKQGWIRPFPWDREQHLLVAGLYWEWLLRKGRKDARALQGSYMEVSYEDLITKPQETLSRIGGFIEHELDYEQIKKAGIGTVNQPNTSFGRTASGFNPVGRWKEGYSEETLAAMEAAIGPLLEELGYGLSTSDEKRKRAGGRTRLSAYGALWNTRHWLKNATPLGQWFTRIE
jgi:hypothetical protein